MSSKNQNQNNGDYPMMSIDPTESPQCGLLLVKPNTVVQGLSFNYLPRNQCNEYVRCPCANSMETLSCPKGYECRMDKNLGNVCVDPKSNSAMLPFPYCS